VHVFATAVVALAGIALGVLVGELAALGLHDRRARVVLGRDQLDVVFLAPVLANDGVMDLGIDLVEGRIGIEHGGFSAFSRRGGSRLPRRAADTVGNGPGAHRPATLPDAAAT